MSCMHLAVTLALVGFQQADASEQWSQEELERVSEEIRAQIEAIRKQEFLRPVAVEITDAKGFVAYAFERLEEMQTPDEIADQETIAKLLGMLPPDMDLLQTTIDVMQEQVGGFYDPGTDTFYLMESFTGGLARVILAHELTHALDDQLYDIDGLLEERLESTDASTAFSAVVEGSGTELMTRWMQKNIGSLTAADLQQATSMGTEALSEAPPFIWKPLMGVYMKGQAFLTEGYKALRRTSEGRVSINDAIAQAFSSPPRSMEQVLHPDRYWIADERDEPRRVTHDADHVPSGWEVRERDTLGELYLGLVTEPLADRKPIDLANPFSLYAILYTNDAAEGWGGDEVLLLGRGDARAVHLATCWDTPRDAKEFIEGVEALRPHIEEGLARLAAPADGETAASGLLVTQGGDETLVTLLAWSGASEQDALALRDSLAFTVEDEDGD